MHIIYIYYIPENGGVVVNKDLFTNFGVIVAVDNCRTFEEMSVPCRSWSRLKAPEVIVSGVSAIIFAVGVLTTAIALSVN